MTKVFLNGRIVPAARAAIPIDDHGFLYGDGVYETVRVYRGRAFLLNEHLRRLDRSLKGLRLRPPMALAAIGRAVVKTVAANRLAEAVVRVTLTRGPGPRGLDPALCRRPTLLITAVPVRMPPPALYRAGVTAAVVSIRRNSPAALPPQIKSISCLNGVLAKMEASRRGAFEAILLAEDGGIAEGTVSNIFAVRGREVSTPRLDGKLLPGVTRDLVLKLARQAGLRVRERRLTPADLLSSDEAFLTSSVMEILPITRLVTARGRSRIGLGEAGPVAADLLGRYREFTRRPRR